jgi:hypothetical protein
MERGIICACGEDDWVQVDIVRTGTNGAPSDEGTGEQEWRCAACDEPEPDPGDTIDYFYERIRDEQMMRGLEE